MRPDKKPTTEQLKALYKAAEAFFAARPWQDFADSDLICVESPETGIIGYCSIMGNAGQHYALGVYLGDSGIAGFDEVQRRGDKLSVPQSMNIQDCIMCSFDDREYLAPEDLKQIKTLGLSYRGRNAWPNFRRYEPGFYPWFINQDECIFLTHALHQVLIVTEEIRSGKLTIDFDRAETIIRRVKDKSQKLQEWITSEFIVNIPVTSWETLIFPDELEMQRIKKARRLDGVVLLAGINYSLGAVQDKKGGRPYFPRILLIVDKKSKEVVDYAMYQLAEEDVQNLLTSIIEFCHENGVPEEIQVEGAKMKAILADFCRQAGIRIKQSRSIAVIDKIIFEMTRFQ